MERKKLCLIEIDNNSFKCIIYNKLLDSPKKKKLTNKCYILDFIKKDFKFDKKEFDKYKI
jgi:hypothetical protein